MLIFYVNTIMLTQVTKIRNMVIHIKILQHNVGAIIPKPLNVVLQECLQIFHVQVNFIYLHMKIVQFNHTLPYDDGFSFVVFCLFLQESQPTSFPSKEAASPIRLEFFRQTATILWPISIETRTPPQQPL